MPTKTEWCHINQRDVERYDNIFLRVGHELTYDQIDRILVLRKEAIKDQEYWLTEKKQREADRNYDAAKYCKGQINNAARYVTAFRYVLPQYMNHPPGDGIQVPPHQWPVEVAGELDRLFREIETC